MKETHLIVIRIPADQRKICYNIAAKTGVKISIHTTGETASILLVIHKDLLTCNLLSLPEELHGVYAFFQELRARDFEYIFDVYTYSMTETKKLNSTGIFDTQQLTI